MDIKEKIGTWVDGRRDDIVADIIRLVSIRSVMSEAKESMPFGEGPAEALNAAMELCTRLGFDAKNYENYAMSADMNAEETAVDILAHLDVVGEGEGWTVPPYEPVIRDGYLYGRGTSDDKGPAVAAAYAMKCVSELGVPMKKNARLILGTDEETGSRDMAYYYSKNRPAPNTFSPDAEFPVYNTEKGRYVCRFSKSCDDRGAVPALAAFDGGFRINVLPSDAEAEIAGMTAKEAESIAAPLARKLEAALSVTQNGERVRLHVKGRSSHASAPEAGNNGITALIEILCALPLADCDSTRALHKLKELFPHGDGEGKALGIAMSDELSGALSLAFSLLKMDENGFYGSFDSRVPLCAGEENCRAVAEKALRAAGFSVEGEMKAPHHTPADRPFVKTLLDSYEKYTGRKGECLAMGGGTYVHDVEGGVAFGASMPGFDSRLHGADERISIDDMLTACKIFAHVIYGMCCGEAEQ